MSQSTVKVGRGGDREPSPVGGVAARDSRQREVKEKGVVRRQQPESEVSQTSSVEGPGGFPKDVAERGSVGQGEGLKFSGRRGGRVRREGRSCRALTSSKKSRELTTIVEQEVKGEGGKHGGKGRETGTTGTMETSESGAGEETTDGRGPERHYRVFGGTGKTPMSTGNKIRENMRTFMDTYHVGVQRIGVSQGYSFEKEEKRKESDLAPYNLDWEEGSTTKEGDLEGTLVYTAFSQLALYCPIKMGQTETYALVDCGAGINLANSRFIAKLVNEFGKGGIEVVRDRLVVRVADGKNWILNRKATIRYEVGGQEFVQEYWLSPDLKELPSLRAQEVSLHIGLKAGTDVLHLRRSGLDVALTHFPNGAQIGDLPLQSVETVIIPRGRGKWLRVGLSNARGLLWPKGKDLTRVVGSTSAQGYNCHAMGSVNSIQNGSTSIFVKAQVEKSSWPIPRISEILDKLHGCSWFSSIDLADGFHQIGVSEESRKYTAFVTEDGLYEYQTVPMGLSISPNHFQYVMDRILGSMGGAALGGPASEKDERELEEQENLIGKDCMIYTDDCLVFSSGCLGDRLERLERVILRLSSFGLWGKSPKFLLARKELKFQYVMDRILGSMGGAALGGPANEKDERELEEQENLIGKDCMIYTDDCLVFSSGCLGNRLERLERVILRLSSFGLWGKSPKFLLARKELKFLWHIIGVGRRRPCQEKIEAIVSGPKTKDMIMAFLGMTGFYRSYLGDFEGPGAPPRDKTLTKADPGLQEGYGTTGGTGDQMRSDQIKSDQVGCGHSLVRGALIPSLCLSVCLSGAWTTVTGIGRKCMGTGSRCRGARGA